VAGVNPDEMLFSVFAMIAGGGVFAYGLTNVRSIRAIAGAQR
jgi:hypothetical protein